MATIAVQHLSKCFGETVAVDDLSFGVEPGMLTGFLGPNGSGKTTTLRLLLGLIRPTSGTATISGRRYADYRSPISVVGAVLDGPQTHPGRTGRDHLRVMAAAADLPARRVDEMLDFVELRDAGRRRVGGYSLGMLQRLRLAAALLGDPQVLVLDEPTNGLDPQGIRWLRDLLRSLAAADRTVIVSSHLLSEVAESADTIIVIDRGRLVAQGTVAELLAQVVTTCATTLEEVYLQLTDTANSTTGCAGGRR